MGQISKFAVPLAVLCLSGCMPDSPRTAFDWGVNDKAPRRVASVSTGTAAKTYTYQEKANGEPAALTAAPVKKATVTSQALPPVGDAPVFAWPVTGQVISDFGSTANGGKNDGINIAAAQGAPIHASAGGTVSYAGDELKDYGNLVLIKHTGGFTTAYAHADRLVVSRGDFVAKGQVIGYAGQTGDVSTPQLHFEIRSGTSPVNPRSYLTSTTASN
jgi:murein DD-endopeptidase MepM/ murein hydrolase activator NlpD